MSVSKIRIAKGRFEAFSDGVFAIAITLLVLELPIPKLTPATESAMVHALFRLGPEFLVYCASFATIGIMWFNHYAIFHYARHISYGALIANLVLLLFVAFLPYPTWLLGQYVRLPAAVAFYGMTLFAISIPFGVLAYIAMTPEDGQASISSYLRSRNAWNTLGPVVYLVGSLLAFASPMASIALFLAIAVFYLAPQTVRGQLAAGAKAHGQVA
jgi:uncharacterized membrane protein